MNETTPALGNVLTIWFGEHERVADTEVEHAARLNGATRIDQIEAVIFETDRSSSVLPTVPQEHRFIDTGNSPSATS